MKCGRPKMPCAGSLRHRISVVRRSLGPPLHGSAEPVYSRTAVLTARAQIETKGGTTEFNRIVIDGESVSHVISIKFPSVEIDARDQIEDAAGNLYRIMKVENPNEYGDLMRLYCSRTGEENRNGAQ